jgi:hypothetical protein
MRIRASGASVLLPEGASPVGILAGGERSFVVLRGGGELWVEGRDPGSPEARFRHRFQPAPGRRLEVLSAASDSRGLALLLATEGRERRGERWLRLFDRDGRLLGALDADSDPGAEPELDLVALGTDRLVLHHEGRLLAWSRGGGPERMAWRPPLARPLALRPVAEGVLIDAGAGRALRIPLAGAPVLPAPAPPLAELP